jgi:hypothetical protein
MAYDRRAIAARFMLLVTVLIAVILAMTLASPNFASDPPPQEDLDGDGVKDSVEPDPEPPGNRPGEVEIRSGENGTLIVRFRGAADNDRFGYSVGVVDDLNGDGFRDLIIGAPLDAGALTPTISILSTAPASRWDGRSSRF